MWGVDQIWVTFGPRSCWMTPHMLSNFQLSLWQGKWFDLCHRLMMTMDKAPSQHVCYTNSYMCGFFKYYMCCCYFTGFLKRLYDICVLNFHEFFLTWQVQHWQIVKKNREIVWWWPWISHLQPSFIYSWSTSHILEHEFFCLGVLGS